MESFVGNEVVHNQGLSAAPTDIISPHLATQPHGNDFLPQFLLNLLKLFLWDLVSFCIEFNSPFFISVYWCGLFFSLPTDIYVQSSRNKYKSDCLYSRVVTERRESQVFSSFLFPLTFWILMLFRSGDSTSHWLSHDISTCSTQHLNLSVYLKTVAWNLVWTFMLAWEWS